MSEKYFCYHTKLELDLELAYCPNCNRADCVVTAEELVA